MGRKGNTGTQRESTVDAREFPSEYATDARAPETPQSTYSLINGDKGSTSEFEQAHPLKHGPMAKAYKNEGLGKPISGIAKAYHEEQLKKFSDAKSRTLDYVVWMRQYLEEQENNYSTKEVGAFKKLMAEVDTCGSWLKFNNYYTVDTYRLSGMISCHHNILCQACALRRSADLLRDYSDRFKIIMKNNPAIKAYFVTFTVKDGDDLEERFKHLQSSVRKCHAKRTQAISCKNHMKVEANKAVGAVWTYQVQVGDGLGLYHPHCHAIWLCYDEPDQARLTKEWQEITGDSSICDVTPFHDQQNIADGFVKVLRYALKFSELPFESALEAHQALKGRRLIDSFGLFRGCKSPVSAKNELETNLPYYELFYSFKQEFGKKFYGLESKTHITLEEVEMKARKAEEARVESQVDREMRMTPGSKGIPRATWKLAVVANRSNEIMKFCAMGKEGQDRLLNLLVDITNKAGELETENDAIATVNHTTASDPIKAKEQNRDNVKGASVSEGYPPADSGNESMLDVRRDSELDLRRENKHLREILQAKDDHIKMMTQALLVIERLTSLGYLEPKESVQSISSEKPI